MCSFSSFHIKFKSWETSERVWEGQCDSVWRRFVHPGVVCGKIGRWETSSAPQGSNFTVLRLPKTPSPHCNALKETLCHPLLRSDNSKMGKHLI